MSKWWITIEGPGGGMLPDTWRRDAARKLSERMTRLPTNRPPTHPGEMLMEEFLTPLGVSQSAFAKAIDVSFPRLNELVKGKRGVTPDTALRLERVLGMPAGFWMNLQTSWDLWHLKHSAAAKAIAQLRPIKQRA